MRKLALEVEKLAVESFETDEGAVRVRGTVRGASAIPVEELTEPRTETTNGPTGFGYTCPIQICDPPEPTLARGCA